MKRIPTEIIILDQEGTEMHRGDYGEYMAKSMKVSAKEIIQKASEKRKEALQRLADR